jgi:ankyrin repeat protein
MVSLFFSQAMNSGVLLEKNAIVNKCDAESLTPLHMACQGGFTEVVKVLLQWNAMIDICDKDGCTPLDIARKQNYPDIEHLNRSTRRKPPTCRM